MSKPYQQSIAQIISELKTDRDKGLSSQEAAQRLQIYGANTLPTPKEHSVVFFFLKQFTSPLVIALIAAIISCIVLGEYKDSIVIGIAILASALVGFVQEWKAEKAGALLATYGVTHATVKRDGIIQDINAQHLVPGDIVFLATGLRVPADIRLYRAVDLSCNEALLTGESTSVKKNCQESSQELPVAEQNSMTFSSTSITSGLAEGIVIATGVNTEFGKIAQLIGKTAQPETPLQNQIKKLSIWIGIAVFVIIIIILIIGYMHGMPIRHVIMIGIALAVAAIPEGLPLAVTSILAIGMKRMLNKKALIRHLVATETLGSVSVICTDKTGTLTQGLMAVSHIVTQDSSLDMLKVQSKQLSLSIQQLLSYCALSISDFATSDSSKVAGQMTDRALAQTIEFFGIKNSTRGLVIIDQIPFASAHKFSALHVQADDKHESIIIKGAPDVVLAMCNNSPKELTHWNGALETMLAQGLRVIAVATRSGSNLVLQKHLSNLSCAGLIGLQDPLRPETATTITRLRRAGINVVLITGDHKETALHIARQAGIIAAQGEAITGLELSRMSDQELRRCAEKHAVFARVNPADKIRLVSAYQQLAYSVAMIGDGVNDAPAIKASNIGVALGSGSDVTHEIADIILLDNNLATIADAVHEGRIIFDNIRKVILYLLAQGLSEVGLIGGALFFGLPLPLLASQILWVNLVTDALPYIALTADPGDPHIMQHKPRHINAPIINKQLAVLLLCGGGIIATGLLLYYKFLLARIADINHIRTLLFTALVIDSLLYTFSIRRLQSSIFSTSPFKNRWLLAALLAGLSLQAAVVYTPFLQSFFSTTPIALWEIGVIIILALAKISVIELIKCILKK